jgi:hypothetical protein
MKSPLFYLNVISCKPQTFNIDNFSIKLNGFQLNYNSPKIIKNYTFFLLN